jgi:hypothetical protein
VPFLVDVYATLYLWILVPEQALQREQKEKRTHSLERRLTSSPLFHVP